MSALPSVDEMTEAYQTRDMAYDGVFFLGVRTTGIFCRPSCPARKPLPQNVEFFATTGDALFAGYRPCKRCHPLQVNGQLPDWASQLLGDIEQDPTLRITDSDLRLRGLNPARVRRFFQKTYGLTFHAYARANRLGKAFTAIRQGADLDEVVLGHGYDSHSGFREAFSRIFGQPPGRSRDDSCIVVSWLESPLGPIIAGATEAGVCLLEFADRRLLEAQFSTLQKRFECAIVPGDNAHLAQLRDELSLYFSGTLKAFTVPLVYPGTPFQQKVWQALLAIPWGETRSYTALARDLGSPAGQRAVGQANGQNRIAILIPCHRLVNKSGQLAGYGGGLWRKQHLLRLEQGEAVLNGPSQPRSEIDDQSVLA